MYMTRKIISMLLFCSCHFFAKSQVVPDSSLTTIDGDTIQLKQYPGKNILLVVIPVSHTPADSLWLLNLDGTYQQYKDSLTLIAVPSYEDGYVDSVSADTKAWYRDTLHLGFIITTGMFTRNSSGEQQSWLFQWLTNENRNGHFGTDLTTYGQKFVLKPTGELKAVFDAATPFSGTLMNIVLRL
jgi:glutathione peroxidase-family protein